MELPSRQFDHADDGTAPLPGFAGRCVEMVSAILVGGRGDAPQVAEVSFTKLYFDESGFVDAAKRERMIRLMLESCADRICRRAPAARPDCATLSRRAGAARDQLMREFAWNPQPAELNAVFRQLDAERPGAAGPTVH
ncbi:hypothetical protein [Azospirillum thermophilum]|uniref:hypothetical protein n=1 Tax=Azospirillum thermophilum TaxID=2202148 RepID=UPI001FE8D199|nr:hypothetical protein [Azospirillum thermophilum]